jgi:hypothetical protein
MFEAVAAPLSPEMLEMEVLEFFWNLFQMQLAPTPFGDKTFWRRVIEKPPRAEVTKCLVRSAYLIKLIFADERVGWHQVELIAEVDPCIRNTANSPSGVWRRLQASGGPPESEY